MNLIKLKYPIGKYNRPKTITHEILTTWIEHIETLPARLAATLAGMSTNEQLDTPYRPDGWTVRQLVHHIADSHLNAHCRVRLALTEDCPMIKPYEQDEWVKLADVKKMPVIPSLEIIKGLHARWAFLLKNLTTQELAREWAHPEHGKSFDVIDLVGMYAWHGNHHLAQIIALKERKGW